MPRQSFDIKSLTHTNPIPAVSRIGPLVMSSIIVPRDPGATTVPDTIEQQLENLFHHVGESLKEAGADWCHIIKMTFHLPDLEMRSQLNVPWLRHFPDAGSRPARHTQLSPGAGAQCDFVAYVVD